MISLPTQRAQLSVPDFCRPRIPTQNEFLGQAGRVWVSRGGLISICFPLALSPTPPILLQPIAKKCGRFHQTPSPPSKEGRQKWGHLSAATFSAPLPLAPCSWSPTAPQARRDPGDSPSQPATLARPSPCSSSVPLGPGQPAFRPGTQ